MSAWLSTWAPMLPAFLVAVGLLIIPGSLVALAARVRGIPALGLAPALSVTMLSVTAIVAGLAGYRLALPAVVAGTLVGVVLSRFAARLSRVGPPLRDSARHVGAVLVGVVVGAACAAIAVARGIKTPETVPQTFDAVFHLSAVWHILQSGDGSSLTLGTVAAPDKTRAFYPGAWHDLTALVAQVSGTSIPLAATAVSLAIAAVVWPLGCVALARQALGGRAGILFTAGVLSAGFAASPYLLLAYGTLWPNALATALLPAVLACAIAALRLTGDDAIGARQGMLLGAAIIPGVALAHPNAVLSALLFTTVMAGVALWRWAMSALPPWRRAVIAASLCAGVLAAEAWLVAWSPVFAGTRSTSWPARQTIAQAVGEWVMAAPMRAPIPVLLTAAVLVGLVMALRRPDLRWLAACHLASGAAFALVAGSDGAVARAMSGPWYDDPFRLAALLGVTVVPLAVVGLDTVAGALVRAVVRLSRSPVPQLILPALVVVLAVATGGVYAPANAEVVARWYTSQALAGPSERALLARLPDRVPAGVLVAGNPWNGSALAEPLGSTFALFPHLSGTWGPDRDLVASRLRFARSDPLVCPAVDRLHIGYVLNGPVAFWPGDPRQTSYAGLDVDGIPGFQPVDHAGRLTLYRITACGRGLPAATTQSR